MDSITIPATLVDEMAAAAKATAPLEACGLVGGSREEVQSFHELTNTDAAAEHFSMHPKEQFAAVKQMRKDGQQMIGVWHSHPETPARMSEEDLRLAFTPDTIYFITSLAAPETPVLKGFVVVDDVPQEVPLAIAPNPQATQ